MGELDSVNSPHRAHDVGDVTDRGAACRTKVEDFGPRLDEDIIQAAEYTSSELASKGVPDTVFCFRGWGCCVSIDGCVGCEAGFNGYPFLAVDGLAGGEIFCDKHVFFAAGNKDTGVSVRFLRKINVRQCRKSNARGESEVLL